MSLQSVFASSEGLSDWEVDHNDIFLRPSSASSVLMSSEDSYEEDVQGSAEDDDNIHPQEFREIVDENWAIEVLNTFDRVRTILNEYSSFEVMGSIEWTLGRSEAGNQWNQSNLSTSKEINTAG